MDPIVTVGSPNPSLQEQVLPASERRPYRNRPVKAPWNVLLPAPEHPRQSIYITWLWKIEIMKNHENSRALSTDVEFSHSDIYSKILNCPLATGVRRKGWTLCRPKREGTQFVGLESWNMSEGLWNLRGKKQSWVSVDGMVQSLAQTPNVRNLIEERVRGFMMFMCACVFCGFGRSCRSYPAKTWAWFVRWSQDLSTQSSHHFGIKMTKTPQDCNMACNFPTGNANSQKLLANILLILACLASHFLLLNRILRLLLVALEASFLVTSISIFVGKVNVYHVLPTYSNHIPIFTIFYQHIPSIFQSFPIIDIHFLILSSYAEFHSHEGYPSWIAWGLGDRPPKLGGAQWLGGAFVLELKTLDKLGDGRKLNMTAVDTNNIALYL